MSTDQERKTVKVANATIEEGDLVIYSKSDEPFIAGFIKEVGGYWFVDDLIVRTMINPQDLERDVHAVINVDEAAERMIHYGVDLDEDTAINVILGFEDEKGNNVLDIERKKLVEQIQKLCEKQYRKGFQQGFCACTDEELTIDEVDEFRMKGEKQDYSKVVDPHVGKEENATERLLTELGVSDKSLRHLLKRNF